MAVVRATCGEHGDFETTSESVVVNLYEVAEGALLEAPCPSGEKHTITKPLDRELADELIRHGSKLRYWWRPEELRDHPTEGDGFTYNEIRDTYQLLRYADDKEIWNELERLNGGERM